MRVLDAGIDSLYWTARGAMGTWYGNAIEARERARSDGRPVAWREIRGYALDALPHGRRAYPFVARAAEFELRLTDSEQIPTAYVQIYADFIRTVGIERAVHETALVVAEVTGDIGVPKASRIDPYVDMGDFRLRGGDRDGLHTRAEVVSHFDGGDDEWLPSLRIGAKEYKVRIYDKRRELRKSGHATPLAWGDFAGPVTRVEVEARSVALRRFGISSVDEALSSYGDVWRHATTRFVALRVPGKGPKRLWELRVEWRAIQEAGGLRFPANGLVPFAQAKGDKVRVLQGLYGGLISLGAHRDNGDLEEVIGALRGELRPVERGRDFAKEVERRRRRLPLAVRLGPPA